MTRELPVALPLGLSFRRGLMVLCETKRNETVLCETWAVKDRDEVECRLDFRRSVVSGLRPPREEERSAGSFPEQRLVIEPMWSRNDHVFT